MTTVLLCTGKKKKIKEIVNYYKQLQNKKSIKILAIKTATKKALFWQYDELKLLFDPLDQTKSKPPEKLLKDLDTHTYRDQALILLDFKTQRLEDKMVKVRVLTTCRGYIAKGVLAKAEQETIRETEYRTFYRCTVQLKGPSGPVVACKDDLRGEGLCDDATINYIF